MYLSRDVHGAAFAALEAAIFEHPWKEDAFVEGPDRIALSLWQEKACICYIYGQQILDEVEIWRIATHPEQRRQGHAAQLFSTFKAWCMKREARDIFLEVAGRNHGAIGFYEHHGFQRRGLRKAYYRDGDDALLMGLELQPTHG